MRNTTTVLILMCTVGFGCGRSSEAPPNPAAARLTEAAGRMNDSEGRSERVFRALAVDGTVAALLADDAKGLVWLGGRGYTARRVGAWGGYLAWQSTLTGGDLLDQAFETALTGSEPAALLRCVDGGRCHVDDVEEAWAELTLEGSCGMFHRVYGIERGDRRYAVIVGKAPRGDRHGLGFRLLGGTAGADAFTFSERVAASTEVPYFDAGRNFRGCFWLGWRGDFGGVELHAGDNAVVLSMAEGKVALTVGDDGLLHATKAP